jgi:hypothetical protein
MGVESPLKNAHPRRAEIFMFFPRKVVLSLQGAAMNARAKSASMITDGERFEEIFQKHTAIPDSEQDGG